MKSLTSLTSLTRVCVVATTGLVALLALVTSGAAQESVVPKPGISAKAIRRGCTDAQDLRDVIHRQHFYPVLIHGLLLRVLSDSGMT